MPYSHKPFNPDENPDTDGEVLFNHIKIARVTRMKKGPAKGMWLWVLEWETDRSKMSGESPTLNEALALIKSLYQASGES